MKSVQSKWKIFFRTYIDFAQLNKKNQQNSARACLVGPAAGEKNKIPVFCVWVRFCSVQQADVLPPSVKASVVLCSRLTWTPPPQGSSSGRNDISHQAGEDGVTGNLLLSDRPCHRLKHSCLLKDFLHLCSVCKSQVFHAFSVYLETL